MLIIYPRKIRRSYLAFNIPVAVGNQDIKMILKFDKRIYFANQGK